MKGTVLLTVRASWLALPTVRLYQAPGPTVCYFVFVPFLLIMALYLLHIKRLCSLREQVLQGEYPQLGKPEALFTSVVTAAKCISLHAASAVTNSS